MRTKPISTPIETVPLDGALHLPESPATAGAVLPFHRNTMNVYVDVPRFLSAPPTTVRSNID